MRSPLLEEKGNIHQHALIANRLRPLGTHATGSRPAFTANDHPVDASQLKL